MCDENNVSSNLGRKEYWDEFYSKELENFQAFGDIGDIWFGKKNVDRIVNWLLENNIEKDSSVLDVGCGNGITLILLGKAGFQNLTGIDYTNGAIQLAKNVAEKNNININFEVIDLLAEITENSGNSILSHTFQIITDKGTYDAISLNPDNTDKKKEQYVKQIYKILSPSGYFIIFSCNWTKEELLVEFKGFFIHDEIKIPSIDFGGKTGQTVTALVLKKQNVYTNS